MQKTRPDPILVALVALGLFLVLDLVEIVYHMTHEGWKSGVTQMVIAFILVAFTAGVVWAYRRRESSPWAGRFMLAACVAASLSAALTLYLSVYHFTHQGTRSGVIEMFMTLLLIVLALSLYRLRPRGQA